VMAFDPLGISEVHDNADLLPIAERAQAALRRAMERVEQGAAAAV